jgi:hypothetical protein
MAKPVWRYMFLNACSFGSLSNQAIHVTRIQLAFFSTFIRIVDQAEIIKKHQTPHVPFCDDCAFPSDSLVSYSA